MSVLVELWIQKANFKYYYPTNDLVTGPDILFFWVARMIIAGYEYTDKKPFTNVYLVWFVINKDAKCLNH
jgi:valyl-tRNA synthetase